MGTAACSCPLSPRVEIDCVHYPRVSAVPGACLGEFRFVFALEGRGLGFVYGDSYQYSADKGSSRQASAASLSLYVQHAAAPTRSQNDIPEPEASTG